MAIGSVELLNDLFNCNCTSKYTIELHGEGYAIYWGRCNHRHGENLATLTDVARKDFVKYFEGKLNGTRT